MNKIEFIGNNCRINVETCFKLKSCYENKQLLIDDINVKSKSIANSLNDLGGFFKIHDSFDSLSIKIYLDRLIRIENKTEELSELCNQLLLF